MVRSPRRSTTVLVRRYYVRAIAMLGAGYLAKRQGVGEAGAGGLGGLLGRAASAGSPGPGGGLPGLTSMLDLNGDGNPLDDIMRMVRRPTR